MHRYVFDSDRVVRKRFIQIIAIQKPSVGHDRIIIAVTDDQFPLGGFSFRCVFLEFRKDARYIFTWTRRGSVELALIGH
jgi:hypothetical protein